MPKPHWEDLDVFVNLDDFAIVARIVIDPDTTRIFPVIFDDPYFDGDLGEYVQDSSLPRFWTKETNVVGIKKHMKCTFPEIPGKVFELLHDPQPDGTGGATVYFAYYTADHD